MIGFFVTLIRFARAVAKSLRLPEARPLLVSGAILLIVGTIFYSRSEHWSVLNAFYFSVTTLTTTGFGDLAPKTNIGKLFTVLYLLMGVGVFVGLVSVIAQASIRKRK